MHIAIKNDNEQVAIHLLEYGRYLDLTIENAEGENVLFFAARLKANNILIEILEAAIKHPYLQLSINTITALNKVHRNGDHLIHQTARETNLPLLNYLRNNHNFLKFNPEMPNKENRTAQEILVT